MGQTVRQSISPLNQLLCIHFPVENACISLVKLIKLFAPIVDWNTVFLMFHSSWIAFSQYLLPIYKLNKDKKGRNVGNANYIKFARCCYSVKLLRFRLVSNLNATYIDRVYDGMLELIQYRCIELCGYVARVWNAFQRNYKNLFM